MSTPRLVMASGTGPGAGKSTMIAQLADVLRRGHGGVAVVMEDDVWGQRRLDDKPVAYASARSEFIELLHSDRARTPSALFATFDQVAASITRSWWLQDWTWESLVRLDTSRERRNEIEQDLVERLATYQAVVLYLQVDPIAALSREVDDRGMTWLSRHAAGLGLDDTGIEKVAAFYGRMEKSYFERLSTGGVPHIVLNAGRALEHLVDDAIAALTT